MLYLKTGILPREYGALISNASKHAEGTHGDGPFVLNDAEHDTETIAECSAGKQVPGITPRETVSTRIGKPHPGIVIPVRNTKGPSL